jgi:hypothetical protein
MVNTNIKDPVYPNFFHIVSKNGQGKLSLSVGSLTVEEAGELWDQWKTGWLNHCVARSDAYKVSV